MSVSEKALPEQAEAFGVERTLPAGSVRRGLLCALAVGAAGMAAWPFASTPFGDDFSYAQTTMDYVRTGHVIYNGWATAILGWMILWGAVCLRVFGESVRSLHLSSWLIGMLSIYVFHGILARFGVSARGAVFGALTLGLSPLFLPLSTQYMTDMPGLLVVLVCLAMCQRAVLARTDHATIAWLLAAAAVNLAGGTVRQICWMGGLVMVPATAWLLRRRRGVLAAGLAGAVGTAVGLMFVLRWFNAQPYTWKEELISGRITLHRVAHMVVEVGLSALFAVLITLPVGLAWSRDKRRLRGAAWMRVGLAMLVFAAGLGLLALKSKWHWVDFFSMPWLEPVVLVQGMWAGDMPYMMPLLIGRAARVMISIFVMGLAWVLVEQLLEQWPELRRVQGARARTVFWLCVPFLLATMGAMLGRAMFAEIQDRYILGLEPILLLGMLLLYQRTEGRRIPAISVAALVVFGLFAVAGNHDLHALRRAQAVEDSRLQAAGVSRTVIAEDFGLDSAVQVADGGHMNEPLLSAKPGEYDPTAPRWGLPAECAWFYGDLVPKIQPKYFFSQRNNGPCLQPSHWVAEPYTAWLPPFHRDIYVLERTTH